MKQINWRGLAALVALAILGLAGVGASPSVKAEGPGLYIYGCHLDPESGYAEGTAVTGPATGYEIGGYVAPEAVLESIAEGSPYLPIEQAQILWIGDGEGNISPTENLVGPEDAQMTWGDDGETQITWSDYLVD